MRGIFMKSKFNAFRQFLFEEEGPTTVEYAIMLAMILGICFLAVVFLAGKTGDSFDSSSGAISGAISN
jgi:pilus assembly protein Flp/PilA